MATVEIPLTQGKVALIDEEDLPQVCGHKWCAVRRGAQYYAKSTLRRSGGRVVYLHRFLMDPSPGQEVDHINRNPLDNRRCNLRLATHGEQMGNYPVPSTNSSGYKGVSRYRYRYDRWLAQISVRGRKKHLGIFTSAEAAASAYDRAAREGWGEFASPNFPTEVAA